MPRFKMSDLPEIGDVVRYERRGYSTLVLPVTHCEIQGGFTDYWLGEQIGKTTPNFNINHTTGLANTVSSEGGRWEIVRKHNAPKPPDLAAFSETVTDAESEFGADLYDLLAKHGIGGTYFGRQRVIINAIKAVRKEA